VGDAEVIPLGTRGKPGRGSGSGKPSSAARSLAGSPARKKAPRATPAPESPDGASGASATDVHVPAQGLLETPPDHQEPDSHGPAAEETAPQEERRQAPAPKRPRAGRATPRLEVRDREPTGGIPVSDWLQALTGAAVEVFGERWEQRLAEFLAFLRRRVTGDFEIDEYGFDAEVTERFLLATVRPLAQKWFRVEVRGAENIPTDGGALVVSNHSGTIPLDGLVTMVSIHDHTGRHLRPLGADLVFRMPFVGELARKGGATLACNEDAQRMLGGGELVGVWPEGFKGIGKPYSDRYKLQRFGRGGFVSAAIRTGVPIVPCSVVGAEEIYPLVGNVPSLARLLGVPYIPITPFFPLLGPLGMVPLPSKWLIEFGEPIRTDAYDGGAADDPMLVFNVTDQVRETVQQTLYTLLMRRRSVFY
jgi:1-acyl-sn-glycerol-3-phosphate acyltransferase